MQITSVIVGTRFQGNGAVRAVGQMRTGDTVRLTREPSNKHDALAVLCIYLGTPVGYLPRATNPRVAAAMDQGITPSAEVIRPAKMGMGRIATEPVLRISWE